MLCGWSIPVADYFQINGRTSYPVCTVRYNNNIIIRYYYNQRYIFVYYYNTVGLYQGSPNHGPRKSFNRSAAPIGDSK